MKAITITIDDHDEIEIETHEIDEGGHEYLISSYSASEPGIWASTRTDDALWGWCEARGMCPPCEHATPGVYAARDDRETYSVSGAVL